MTTPFRQPATVACVFNDVRGRASISLAAGSDAALITDASCGVPRGGRDTCLM